MSEVPDDDVYRYIGQSSVNAHPGPELSQALERFIHPDRLRQLGGRALLLRSEQTLSIIRGETDEATQERRSIFTKGELVAMSQALTRRQQSVKPRVSPAVTVSPYRTVGNAEATDTGIDLRFRLVIDRMTEQVLSHTVLLAPDDNGLYVHFRLQRHQMRLGSELLAARDDLVSLLHEGKPNMIESMYLSMPDRRH